jgi:hypothetical protein
MAILISDALVLSGVLVEGNKPIIAYQNNVTFSSITATSSTNAGPITNAANPATSFVWRATSNATQVITINNSGAPVNYIGIARHNLNQAGLTAEVRFNGVVVLTAQAVQDNQALLIYFDEASPDTITITLAGATIAPTIGVIYAGLTMRLERSLYVGHTPITYARDRKTINGMSENGQYLGEIVVRESKQTQVSIQNLHADWYRTTLDPFFALSPRVPCFFAWRPDGYPSEVGYCWIEGEPKVSNQLSNGMMQASWVFRGLA